jgi:hypothetical protein
MRMHSSVLSLCLLTWACTSDEPETSVLDSGGGPMAIATADAGTTPVAAREAGALAPQGPLTEAGARAQTDAAPAGGSLPSSDAGTDASAAVPGDGGPGADCPAKFSTASYIQIDMSWPGTAGYLAGNEFLQAWAKTTFTRTADGFSTESVICGNLLPVVTGTILIGEAKLANEIPLSAFDQPSMPRTKGRLTRQGGKVVIDVGTAVLGTSLTDANARWPTREAIQPVDHDGDGKPGMTAIARKDPPYSLPPVDILLSKQADAMYTASRMGMRLLGASEGCKGPAEGSVEPLAFDSTIIGCRLAAGGDCGEPELNLLENQSPLFTLGSSGRWKSVPIADGASCADVRNAVPAPE